MGLFSGDDRDPRSRLRNSGMFKYRCRALRPPKFTPGIWTPCAGTVNMTTFLYARCDICGREVLV